MKKPHQATLNQDQKRYFKQRLQEVRGSIYDIEHEPYSSKERKFVEQSEKLRKLVSVIENRRHERRRKIYAAWVKRWDEAQREILFGNPDHALSHLNALKADYPQVFTKK
jgi:hypothetical protein